jgi:NAD(P)-dependent dehydrogenase (short-subunit alcohol dehydrogenase family)
MESITKGGRAVLRGVVLVCLLVSLRAVPASAQEEATPSPGQRVVLVTGSTSGLGQEVALQLGALGVHVIVHGRDSERGQQVADEINRGPGSARFYRADFASFAEVRTLAEAILSDYDRLDVLVNNAGVGPNPNRRLVSEDGHELRFQVNYLSHFLLTRLLLPRLHESTPSRIVNVASRTQSPIDFDDVMLERGRFSGGRAYGQSKLAQIGFTFDLHGELDGSGVLVNVLHPASMMPTRMTGASYGQSTVAEGAEAVMQLIEAEGLGSGHYFRGLDLGQAHPQMYDAEARRILRELTRELTGVR